ncbi:hypothetical protein J4573_12200 [Actinomadura barringtoniae]|uniref:IPT/TIG domain-containing protein n=1 Tax=Actinomadura barringtoniae TaxID=1427535 RepID=A0A939PG28_9ACTN|nr:hypothetical protein [Actinomadura barringtoniae]MBO2447856.1 hypothetical protein [Actinomadura barringtoniae]
MRPVRRLPAVLLCVVAGAWSITAPAALAAGPPNAPPGGPGATAVPAEAAIGTAVRVRGSAWTPGATVQVQICGANAVHGSADCDTQGGVTALISPAGTFDAGLAAGAPPAACPCVIQVSTLPGSPGAPRTVTFPFRVLGHRVAVILKDITPVRADIVDVEVTGGGGWGELFGGRPRRTLVVQVRNAGADPIVGAPLTVGWGAGSDPDSPVDSPRTGTLRPGQTATYRVPVELPPASFGTFVVGGRYAAAVPFKTTFSAYPWGLLGVNAVALLLFLLGLRLAFARRAARRRTRATERVPAPMRPPVTQHITRNGADELLDYLDETAREPSGDYRIDREALSDYLRRRTAGPIDVAALEDFLALDRFKRQER